MLRALICSAAFVVCLSLGTLPLLAQSSSPKPKSSGEIAAASRLLAEKDASCRQKAREQKLTFLQRRRFIRGCIKGTQ